MDLSAFYSQFREETAENVRALSDGLLALEHADDPAVRRAELDRIFRAAHTIKGSARMLGFEPVSRLAHAIEQALDELRMGRRELGSALAGRLLRGGDALLALSVAAVEGGAADLDLDALIAALGDEHGGDAAPGKAPLTIAPPPPGAAPDSPAAPAAKRAARTVRVRVDRLDRMLNLAGELMVGQQVLANHADQLGALRQAARQHERAIQDLEDELGRLRFSAGQRQAIDQRLAALRQAAGQSLGQIQRQAEHFGRHVGQSDLLVRDLEQEVMAARLVPIATIYAGLPRTVRDLAQATGKLVQLELQGETVELDRKVLELLQDPLLHLVRNAVDHAIEPAEARLAAGKPATGTISVRAEAFGGEVRVTVADDGGGIERGRLRERAVRMSALSAEQAARLTDAEALDLIFLPGLSTAPMVTDISGRGVGLDVVRSNLSELSGQVAVSSQLGRGTAFTLSLPLTLVTTRVLLVRLGQASFGLPASSCQGTIWVQRAGLRSIEGQPTIAYDGRAIVVRPLAELVGVSADPPFARSDRAPAVLVGSAQRPIALLVDALLDERETVVKPLGPLLAGRRIYSGATQLGDGSLVLLLNPIQLMHNVARGHSLSSAPARPQPARRPRLLVCDDSFTTRELIRSILQSAGYDVTAAVDGADALDKLRAQAYDLVVSDVEMPRVDGFQLTARIRSELALHELPVILITSLSSDDHRRRGLEAGAQAYIVKNQFDQDSLLEIIQQLLGHEA